MEYWSISHNITQPDSMPRSNPDQESFNNAFQFHLGTFLFLSGLNGVLPTCRRTTNSHMSLTERRIGIHHRAAYAHTSKLRWLNSPPLPPRQVLARAYHDAANLRPRILFVKSFHMLNCRRGIEIPGNVGMSRRCGTQMQRHTREVCNQGDDNPLPRAQCPAKSLLHVAYVVGTNHLPKTPFGGCN